MNRNLQEALEDVDIAFHQLEFAIRLLSYCELGNLDLHEFDQDHLTMLPAGSLHFPRGKFADVDSVVAAASVNVLITFSASVLVLDQAFEAAGIKFDPQPSDDIVRLRTLVYMVRCAHAHRLADPQWHVSPKYRQRMMLTVDGMNIDLDLAVLDQASFDIEAIGGYLGWYRIRDAALRAISP